MNKTVIISGLNGQLGQYMAKYLLDNEPDIKVIGTIRHKSFDDQVYIFDRSKVIIELMDLGDAHSIENIIIKYKPDYYINTAANAFVGESWAVPVQHFELNCLGVLHQLEAIRKHSPFTRYFNMGTSEEFGATKKGLLNESSLLFPKSPYGASKVAARQIVRVWRESYGLYAIQGWTFNFESPIRGEKYITRKITKGVARIAKALKDGCGTKEDPIELGNLDSHRSWQFAGDVADGIWKMLNQGYPPGCGILTLGQTTKEGWTSEEYNRRILSQTIKEYVLSSSHVYTIRDLIKKAFEAAGIKTHWVKGRYSDLAENGKQILHTEYGAGEVLVHDDYLPDCADQKRLKEVVVINPKYCRPNDVTYLHGDASAIKRDLGWEPKIGFDQLVEDMVKSDMAALGL